MSKFFLLAQRSLDVKSIKKIKLLQSAKNLKLVRFFLLGAFIFLLLGNVLSINRNIAKGYEIATAREATTKLKEDKKNLEIEIANLKSLQSIEERVKQFDLVPAAQITYLTEVKNVVVAKK